MKTQVILTQFINPIALAFHREISSVDLFDGYVAQLRMIGFHKGYFNADARLHP